MAWILFIAVVFVVVFLLVARVYLKGGEKSDKGSCEPAGDTSSVNDASSDE